MHRETPESGTGDESCRFFTHLADGLHAMAQPLTILRSAAVASAAPELPAAERLRYLDISREQIERACSLFEHLQDLVIAKRNRATCTSLDLSHLVTEIVTYKKGAIQASGAELTTSLPSRPVFICGDVPRTRQAIGATLGVAIALSEPGDAIDLSLEEREGSAELAIRNRRRHGNVPNSSQHLSLALAETNIRSQRGEFKRALDPFSVQFALPLQNLDRDVELPAVQASSLYSSSIPPSDGCRLESER